MADSSAAHAEGHAHPGWQMYVIIALILFALTALDRGERTHHTFLVAVL